MARVVPTQVVALVNRSFHFNQGLAQIDAQHAPQLTGILSLARDIPTELLTITGQEYAEYVVALGAIDFCLRFWISRGGAGGLAGVSGKSPVFIVREALAKCPDEAPSPTTTKLAFITDSALRESIRLDINAANQDLANGVWKGATVLAGSALEALLLWAVQEADQKKTGAVAQARAALVANKTLKQDTSTNPEWWGLAEFVEVSYHLKFISDESRAAARLAQGFRNLIHAARARRLGQACDIATAMSAMAAVEHAARDLSN